MTPFEMCYTAALAILGSARISRLLVHDTYPPSVWLRRKWDNLNADKNGDEGPWGELLHCHYCASMYVTPVVLASGYLSGWAQWWYMVTAILSAAYLAAVFVTHDGS